MPVGRVGRPVGEQVEQLAGVALSIRQMRPVRAPEESIKGVAAEQVVSGVRAIAAGHAVFGPSLATRMLEFFGGPRPREPRFPELSAREHEVLAHLANGWTNQQIADELVISPITVRNHVSSILTKLRLTNRREAMLRYHDR